MPFLRVIRDKRGYETTYLMHWYREGNRQRSRILYVFRTPGGIRVGRDSIDPEARRALERQHPDIAFDWNAVISNQQLVEGAPERRTRRRRDGDREVPAGAAPAPAPIDEGSPQAPSAAASRFTVPAVIAGGTPDEQIAFLHHWYGVVRDHLSGQPAESPRVAVMRTLAERLNPVSWTDADQTAAGLAGAADALERLSRLLSRRRRRPRRAVSRPGAALAAEASGHEP